MVNDLTLFLYDAILFCAEIVINDLEVDLVASRSEAMYHGVVGYNTIIVHICIEGVTRVFLESQW